MNENKQILYNQKGVILNKTILCIMSDVRSGSTLLENILSNAPNTISVGELCHLDSHLYKGQCGKTWNWTCTCGMSITTCIFWKKILKNLKEKDITICNTTLQKIKKNDSENKIKKISTYNKKILNTINEIYGAVFEKNNFNTIIDSSKHTDYVIQLYKSSDYSIKIIYLKRDIRAVVLSKIKWATIFGSKNKNIYKTLINSKMHDIFLKKQLKQVRKIDVIRVKYEDLAQNPQNTINKIAEKFNLPYFDAPEYMDSANSHTIGGTPNRFGKIKIKYDEKWKTDIQKKLFFNIIAKTIDCIL